MEFAFTPEQEAFRQEVRRFLERECTAEVVHALNWDPDAQICRQWQRKMAAAGLLTLGWPKKYGGQERSLIDQAIFLEEAGYYGALDDTIIVASQFSVGPVLLRFGSEALQQRFLPRIARGELRFTNALTEPEAGTDLASLKTRAQQDGDFYVLSGQKTFITGADRVDFAHVATRTDPNAPVHQGISMFIVDARSPGFQVRPMTNILGKRNECQVFLDNVRVPAGQMVGEKNRGWYILMGTLDILRSGISGVGSARRYLEQLCQAYREGAADALDPERRARVEDLLARMHVEIETWRMLAWRVVWAQHAGQMPTHEVAESSFVSKTLSRQLALVSMEMLGDYAILRRGSKYALLEGEGADQFLESSHLQAGGTREILRTVVAQRGLGLPRG